MVGQRFTNQQQTNRASPRGFEGGVWCTIEPISAANCERTPLTLVHDSDAKRAIVGGAGRLPDDSPAEDLELGNVTAPALALALQAAVSAQRWGVAASIAAELQARQRRVAGPQSPATLDRPLCGGRRAQP